MMKAIIVEEYNPVWKDWFKELKAQIWPIVSKYSISIEHVGSTCVIGLAAKPKIDIDIVVQDQEASAECIKALKSIGYTHRGNLGIVGREAFSHERPKYKHSLYVCLKDSDALKNHLTLREHLKTHQADVKKYSEIKLELAKKYPHDIDSYVDGKTEFIVSILEQYDFNSDSISSIREANLKK